MKMRVLDLNSGLGGRIYAFEKAGFEVVAAIFLCLRVYKP